MGSNYIQGFRDVDEVSKYGEVSGELRKFLLDGQWNYDPEYSVDCEQRDLFGYYASRYY